MHQASVRAQRYAHMKPLKKTILEYLRTNVLITTSGVAWAPAIKFTQQVVGEDRVMYAMDYPYQFHADEVRTHDTLDIPLAQQEKADADQRRALVQAVSRTPLAHTAGYALALVALTNAISLLDRNILAILAPRIKHDLGIGDAEMGLLYGTVFALFYALFSLPLGRLADGWVRTRLLAIALAFWSLATALAGAAQGFALLALSRLGVGIGEGAAQPAGFSLVFDRYRQAAARLRDGGDRGRDCPRARGLLGARRRGRRLVGPPARRQCLRRSL